MEHDTSSFRGRVVVFGEVLFDVFPDGEDVLGGAPFNVAWHLAGFGVDPLFLSRIGRDRHGRRVREAVERWGMEATGIQEDPDRATGRVTVELEDGRPTFEILEDRAWDHVDAAEACRVVGELPEGASLLYQGTLIERSPGSRRALASLLDAIGAPVFLDVNLRPPWWERSRVVAALARARWVKLNEDELAQVHEGPVGRRPEDLADAARRVQRRWDLDVLVVTQAERGAVLVTAGGVHRRAPTPLGDELEDTVGAGDAFSAVMILGLLEGWSPETVLARGVDFAAEICRRRGATPSDRELYRDRRERWSATV
jgi:fructokinase